jgi:hypothetical protein
LPAACTDVDGGLVDLFPEIFVTAIRHHENPHAVGEWDAAALA